MLQRTGQQRLHLVLGSPWKEALGTFYAADAGAGLWQCEDYDKGDLLLTVLDCTPRVLLCLERTAASGPDPDIEVDEVYAFPQLLFVPSITSRLGRRLPLAPGPVPDRLADRLLEAIAEEIASPTPLRLREGRRCASTSRLRASGLQAVALARSEGRCEACDRDFGSLFAGAGLAALEVHHLDSLGNEQVEVVETSVDRLTAVCGGCHNVLHSVASPTLQELRYAWRPPCPQCHARQTKPILFGMPVAAPPDDVILGGCDVSDPRPEWQCGSCGHEWGGW